MSEQTPTEPQPETNSNSEAAKYRTKLREAEAQLARISGQRDTLARSIVESNLPGHVTPDLFWKIHPDLDGLVTDTGEVDTTSVARAAQDMTKAYGLNPQQLSPVVPNAGDQPDRRSFSNWQSVVTGQQDE